MLLITESPVIVESYCCTAHLQHSNFDGVQLGNDLATRSVEPFEKNIFELLRNLQLELAAIKECQKFANQPKTYLI